MGAGSASGNSATKLGDSAGASGGLEPGDELLNGELLGESGGARASGARASGASGRGSRGRGLDGGGLSGGGGGGGGRGGSGRGRGLSRRGGGAGGGSGAGGGRRRRAGAGATAHGEVDAGLVGLVDGRCVPEPLDHAVTLVGALGADIGHGDLEVGPVGVSGDGGAGESVLVPADEGRANDCVGLDVDDGDVGDTVVGSADLDLHGDDLAGGVLEDLTGVLEGDTLALPHAAVGVRTLEVLESALDVAVEVGALLVVDLVTAGSLEALAGHTGSGGGDEAVGGDGGGEASKGNGGGVGLHFESWLVDWLEGLEESVVRS